MRDVLAFYNDNVGKALLDLFPEVEWEKSQYYQKIFLRGLWKQPENRRKFFIDFAQTHNFNLYSPENWLVRHRQLRLAKHAVNVLSYHGNTILRALPELFPDYNWDILRERAPKDWQDSAQRRRFFELFAWDSQFDPLNPENWYLKTRKIMATKNSKTVLSYHGNSVLQALQDLFPEVWWENSNFYKKMMYRDTAWQASMNSQFMSKFVT